MKTTIYIIILLLSTSIHANQKHEFHISVAEMGYNASESMLQITFKVFTDDMEKALSAMEKKEIKIQSQGHSKKLDTLIYKYFDMRFKVDINNSPKKISFIGQETDLEATWCYFMIENVNEHIDHINISSFIMTEIFEDQQNIIHLKINQFKKSVLLNKDKTQEKIIVN